MGQKVGSVEFYAGPKQLGAPDDLEDVIIKFIKGAKKKLCIAVQELENENIANAIIEARLKRKVSVEMVIEQSYLRIPKTNSDIDPWQPLKGNNEANRTIHDALLRANIDVKTDYNEYIFHQKFIIRDGKDVLTGSTNFTDTGTSKNLNHIVIVRNKPAARVYQNEFDEISEGNFGRLSQNREPAPKEFTVSNVPVKILFAPDHNPEMEIMKQMLKARKRIDFAIFTFAASSGIDDTMIRLCDLDMPITGAFDGGQGVQSWAAIPALKKAGADLYKVKKTSALGKLHHKLMVLDDQVVIAGSFNYTGPANLLNDENIIILGDMDTTSKTKRDAQKKIASFARREIERIIADHGTKI